MTDPLDDLRVRITAALAACDGCSLDDPEDRARVVEAVAEAVKPLLALDALLTAIGFRALNTPTVAEMGRRSRR